MSKTDEQPISAVKGTGDNQQKREFTPTQWASMGKDKAGWKPATPTEALLTKKQGGASGADVALLNARERYAALFEKQPAANASLEALEGKIAAELAKQNAGDQGDQGKKAKAAKPAPAVATGTLPPADANTGAGDAAGTGGDADASKGAADAAKGLGSQTEQA